MITSNEKQRLEDAYAGRKAVHGELHDHSNSGGTSDGKCGLDIWKKEMPAVGLDFAAILDHEQVRHMYLPEWDDALFVSGSEPGTHITDSDTEKNALHYNMIFEGPAPLEEILTEFPEFRFEGGREGHFRYPDFTAARFGELMDAVREKGGFFVIPHPKQIMVSDNPLSYWFRDYTGLEVFYIDLDHEATEQNYPLWTSLLAMGKKVWACAGGDLHNHPGAGALTTIYSDKKYCPAYLKYLRTGDFTCGSVGIRMLMGDTRMGGEGAFKGQRLLASVGDFHDSVLYDGHQYVVRLIRDSEVVDVQPCDPSKMNYYAWDAEDSAAFYRLEVWDASRAHLRHKHPDGYRIAIGNPVWNLR